MLKEISQSNIEQLREFLESRKTDIPDSVMHSVMDILADVRDNKDEACRRYTKQFDGVDVQEFRVPAETIEAAAKTCEPFFREALEKARDNILFFHNAQKQNSYILQKEDGIYLGQRVLPLDSIGIYVPGGRAQYPSSVLMNVIPAKVAGVRRIVMVTPPDKNGSIHPNIALAAMIAGVDEIYTIGGAQAIAALAYGTETIAPVDKITGPGNIYVAAAKKLVFGKVDIDMIAGPSEILVIADEGADPAYVAADLLSQAEHDPMASAILLTTSRRVLDEVNAQVEAQLSVLPKQAIASASVETYGKAIVCDTVEACIELSNAIAPEHLELMTADPMRYLHLVRHAGSVFMGYYTCESIGDYFGGTNHVLPTGGTARFSSALGVDAFIKKSSFLHYTKEALDKNGKYIVSMAQQEQLQGHANAAIVRMDHDENNV